jgi:hypothetical protein
MPTLEKKKKKKRELMTDGKIIWTWLGDFWVRSFFLGFQFSYPFWPFKVLIK